MSIGFSPLFTEKRGRQTWQHPCLQAWHRSLSPNFLLPLRATGSEEPHTVRSVGFAARPATKLETRALTESAESCAHRGRSFWTALWLSLGRTLIDSHLLERNLLKTSVGGTEFDFSFSSISSLYTEQLMLALKKDQIKALFSIYQISRKGKKKLSALAYFCISISFYISAFITLYDVWFTLCI